MLGTVKTLQTVAIIRFSKSFCSQRKVWQLAKAVQAAQLLCLILRNWSGINA